MSSANKIYSIKASSLLWIPGLTVLFTSIMFSACKPPETTQRSRIGGRGAVSSLGEGADATSGNKASKKNKDGSDNEEGNENDDGENGTKNTIDGNSGKVGQNTPSSKPTATPTPSPSSTPGQETVTSYPVLFFKGKGSITNDGKTYSSSAEITTTIDESKLVNDVTAVNFIVKDNQDKADKSAAETKGPRTLSRPSTSQIKALSGFNNASFTLYTNNTLKKGVSSSLSSPLPMFPRPGNRSQFKDLDGGPLVWTASINGKNTATIIVMKVSETANRYTLKYSLTIDGDVRGELYGTFPISKESIYEMDTENSRIVSITMTDWWKNADENKRESGTTVYKLCKQVKAGKTDTFPCE